MFRKYVSLSLCLFIQICAVAQTLLKDIQTGAGSAWPMGLTARKIRKTIINSINDLKSFLFKSRFKRFTNHLFPKHTFLTGAVLSYLLRIHQK